MIDLFLSSNRNPVFLKQKKKSNHSKHVKGLSISRGGQNQNVFQPTARDLGISYVNIKFSNESVPYPTVQSFF